MYIYHLLNCANPLRKQINFIIDTIETLNT